MIELVTAMMMQYELHMGIRHRYHQNQTAVIEVYRDKESCNRDRENVIRHYSNRMTSLNMGGDFRNFFQRRMYIECHPTNRNSNTRRVHRSELKNFEIEFLGAMFHEYQRCKVFGHCD